MYSSMCFLSVVSLLMMDMRTGALQDRAQSSGLYNPGSHRTRSPARPSILTSSIKPRYYFKRREPYDLTVNFRTKISEDIQPSRCYSCRTNGTSCEQSASWTTVMCPAKRPLCATSATAPDFHSSMICAPISKKVCTARTPANSSTVITCVCNTHVCNAPFAPEWRNELINFTTNNINVKQQNFYQLLNKFTNNTEEDNIYKAITSDRAEVNPTVARSSEPTFSVSATLNINTILRDSDRPKAEALKQEPTVPSDDDEDESEGSGSYEDSRVHNHAVSAPAAPSSFLPANENSASLMYKDLLITTLFIYLVI